MTDVTTTHTRTTTTTRSLTQALLIGAVVQAALISLPLLDLWIFGSTERHVQAAYPGWGPAEVGADTMAIVVGMAIVGVAGVSGWLFALLAVRRDRRTRAVVTTLFIAGLTVLAFVAGYGAGPYDQIVPLWMGMTTLGVSAITGATALLAAWWRKGR